MSRNHHHTKHHRTPIAKGDVANRYTTLFAETAATAHYVAPSLARSGLAQSRAAHLAGSTMRSASAYAELARLLNVDVQTRVWMSHGGGRCGAGQR